MILDEWFTQELTVETYTGAGEYGDEYGSPATVRGMLDHSIVLSRGPGGDVLAAATVFYTRLEYLDLFRPESRVTVNGTAMQVESVKPRQAAPMFRQLEHLEVQLK